MYGSAVFTGVSLFVLKFYQDNVVPINQFWIRKLEILGYPKVKTASLSVPSF